MLIRSSSVRGKDRVRVPDFYNLETREIIEIFGTYWHRDRVLPDNKKHETPEEYIDWYKELGYNCTIVWAEEEFEEFYSRKKEEVDGKKSR